MSRIRLGLMASGRGSNAEALLRACKEGRLNAEGALVVSNKVNAGVHEVAQEYGVPSKTIARDQFESGKEFARTLIQAFQDAGTDLVCLAGYMKKVPPALIRAYPKAMLNIHPALLPAHGGKGMYGIHVHEDILACGDSETGVTVHFVDAEYDRGPILLQRGGVEVHQDDTPEQVAARVLKLEHVLYTEAVAKWIAERGR
ncbi:phosphoribosylglycinamide formyltransferase [bacterium]|nr:phosphoribosylglycinamide formyltransferase [bacterium]